MQESNIKWAKITLRHICHIWQVLFFFFTFSSSSHSHSHTKHLFWHLYFGTVHIFTWCPSMHYRQRVHSRSNSRIRTRYKAQGEHKRRSGLLAEQSSAVWEVFCAHRQLRLHCANTKLSSLPLFLRMDE